MTRKYRQQSMNKTLKLAINKYDNIVLVNNLNVEMIIPGNDIRGYWPDICDTFDLPS